MLKKIFKRNKKSKYGWFGDYPSWQDAQKQATGYDNTNILEKTRESLLKVKNGEAVYERDSVIFDKKEYPFPVISALLFIALNNNNKLRVLDFGGSLGSTWFQVKDFIPPTTDIIWTIVEQEAYVKCGKQYFEDDQLKFAFTIEECMQNEKPDVILLSSVIQYLEKPHEFLQSIIAFNPPNIIFDRTAFIKNSSKDRITLQIVPPDIYEASYPSWFFNEENFLKHFSDYKLIAEFAPYVESESSINIDDQPLGYDKGFFLRKK